MIKHIFKLIWNKKASNFLMVLEIFLSFIVLFVSLSFVIYNYRLLNKPLGFDTEDRWMVYLNNMSQMDSLSRSNLKETLQLEMEQMDNIKNVAFGNYSAPFSGNNSTSGDDSGGFLIRAKLATVNHEFGETMNLNLLSGRFFNENDYANPSFEPVVVNQPFMDKHFPNKNMIDSIIVFSGEKKIIGVVEDFRYNGEFTEQETFMFYLNHLGEDNMGVMYLEMENGTNAQYEESVNKRIAEVLQDESFIILKLEEERKLNSRSTWIPIIAILSICTFLCVNVALGLFGILWYNINKRKSEIGLRRALGAHSSDITKQFIFEILSLTGVAVLLGIFFAIQVPLLKLGPLDPINLYYAIGFSTLIIMVLVTVCALYPSWQASKIHPAIALHED